MRIPFSILLALVLSLDTFAAPVPNAEVGDELALEVRAKAKVAAKKPAVKAPAKPAVKAKPVAPAAVKKPVAAKPAAKPVAKAPVAVKKPVAAKPVVKAPVKAAPVKAVPVKAAPVKAAPVKAAPVKAAPVKAAPVKAAPVKAAPVKAAPVKAAPVKAAPIKAAPVKAAPVKAAPVKAAPAKAAASAKPSKLPKCTPAQVEARELEELEARLFGSVSHPAGTGTITLFHGTTAANAAQLAAGAVDLSRTRGTGDFNHRPEVPGGFYLTDSLVAAAQFACFGIPGQRPAQTDVVEYRWTGAGQQVFTFPGENADWLAFQQFNANPNEVVVTTGAFAAKAAQLFQNDMIVGPLNGPADFLLTDDFQQYAVIQQAAASNNLAFQRRHQNILCRNVPTGNELTAGLYKQGQAGNAKFNTRLAKLQNPNFQPGGGSCVIQ